MVCAAILSGCSSIATDVSDVVKKELPDNPFSIEAIPLRDLISDPDDIYLEQKEIVIGPLRIMENDIKRKCFWVYLATGVGFADYDSDASIEIYYGDLANKTEFTNLESDKRPVIFAKGMLNMYGNSSDYFFTANDISIVMKEAD